MTTDATEVSGKKVLIIDDEPQIRASIAQALRMDGIRPLEAESGEEGLAMIAAEPPDFVVLDIDMPPGIDGFETCRRIRAGQAGADVPLLFLSRLDGTEEQLMGHELGAYDYVSKEQFSSLVLRAKLRNFLRLAEPSGKVEKLRHGRLAFDGEAQAFSWDEKGLDLTTSQLLLLRALLRHPAKVFSRDELIDAVHPKEHGAVVTTEKTIDSHVAGIRRALKRLGVERGTVIRSRAGLGYELGECR
ncbi:MAG: response regulator transcription factor [Myxococcota bacterium]|nr:response regulator transcription factor [Myxococcota bacterium]